MKWNNYLFLNWINQYNSVMNHCAHSSRQIIINALYSISPIMADTEFVITKTSETMNTFRIDFLYY